MKQSEIYLKDIYRKIDSVIKADDESDLILEVEEYVITAEIEQRLESFIGKYGNADFNDSVWISGYFGSGKSHLLKMLSLVLENKTVDDYKCGDKLITKIEDKILAADFTRAISTIPCNTILFNIAQKADGIGNANISDPILAVFFKVFNDYLDYFGQMPAIAMIERHLDEEGLYDEFKKVFFELNGKTWADRRKHIMLDKMSFAKAYGKVKQISEDEAKKALEDTRSTFNLDIDGFADIVADYLKKQVKGFRLAFCVDEVGQFIAEDVNLMLSLQTIAGILSIKTKGQAFLIVTSQNDISETIGDKAALQKYDFSRIYSRFGIKLGLTSKNADEVIQKRLLQKNSAGCKLLKQTYSQEHNNLKTIFAFEEGTRKYTQYKSDDHFILTYPFIPYQFDLLQEAVRALSEHNAFIGNKQSVGERSMLSVFQVVAKLNSALEIGSLATFDQMYEGTKESLQSNILADINSAEKSMGISHPLAVRVLKTLFMVKYVKGFQATVKNITTLLVSAFDTHLGSLQKEVQSALNLLEGETYIQRTAADKYSFLTNQEKDVENEIKSTELNPGETGNYLERLLFQEIITDNKIKLDGSNQPYEFGRKIDESLRSRDADIYLHFITPLYTNTSEVTNLAALSMDGRDLIVHLNCDVHFLNELRLICKTDKYIQVNNSIDNDPIKHRIMQEKSAQNSERKKALLIKLKEAVGDAKIYLNGAELNDLNSKDPQIRINKALNQLIMVAYPNLKMLTTIFTEKQLEEIIYSQDSLLFSSVMHETEKEILDRITRNKLNSETTTIKILLDFFKTRPYGWYQTAVLCLLAKLYKRSKIALRHGVVVLESNAVLEALKKSNQYDKTAIDLEEIVDNTTLNKFKQFHLDYFSENNQGKEPKEVIADFKKRLKKEVDELHDLYAQRHSLAFLKVIKEPLDRLELLKEKDSNFLFNSLVGDVYLDDKEDVLDGIKKFMSGDQLKIYRNIVQYLENNKANFSYIAHQSYVDLLKLQEETAPYRGSFMQKSKIALEELQKSVDDLLNNERQNATNSIMLDIEKLKTDSSYVALSADKQQMLTKPLSDLIEKISSESFIGNIRDCAATARNDLFTKQLSLAYAWANPVKVTPKSPDKPDVQIVEKPEMIFVKKNDVKIDYKKSVLTNSTEVEEYLTALKAEYLKIIGQNKRITL